MDSSRECRHATCATISPGCERCVTSRNRSPSSPPDPVKSPPAEAGGANPLIAAVHACPDAPTRAVNQPYSLHHRRKTGLAQPTSTRNTRIRASREVMSSIYFYDTTAKSNCAKKKRPARGVNRALQASVMEADGWQGNHPGGYSPGGDASSALTGGA